MTESIDAALKDGKIGTMQYHALKKHAEKHDEQHKQRMLKLMAHVTFAKAHREAKQEVGQ